MPTQQEYKSFYDEFDPHKVHGVRVAYAMHRAVHSAMETAGDYDDGIEFEVLRLLRSWGFEVIELPFVVGADQPARKPIPDAEDADE